MLIRPALSYDAGEIWSILEPVVRSGETYTLDRDMSRTDAMAYWLSPGKETFVAEDGGKLVGTYYICANQAGGGGHVCNCGFVTRSDAAGRGVARRMCEHALAHARSRSFKAMQFNFVVATNDRAIRLWQSLGFETVGRLPQAFDHPAHGFVDALVMFKTL